MFYEFKINCTVTIQLKMSDHGIDFNKYPTKKATTSDSKPPKKVYRKIEYPHRNNDCSYVRITG